MIFHTASEYGQQARDLFHRSAMSKRLMLIHAAVAQGSILLIYFIGFLLDLWIANTGGLSGMGLRTFLSTVQSTGESLVMIALPFWQASLFFMALRWARNRYTESGHLLQGFRRFGSVLSYQLLYGLVFCVLGFAVLYLSSAIFVMTPFSTPILDEIAPIFDPSSTTEQIEAVLSPERMDTITNAMIPFFIFSGIAFIIISIPVFYRLRLGQFAVMDNFRGRSALLSSFRATRKNWLPILKLDLHFWWYYALQLVCLLIANGNWLLPWLGISLPMGEDAAFFLFFGLGTVLQILILWQFQGQVITSHALLYETYFPAPAELPLVQE